MYKKFWQPPLWKSFVYVLSVLCCDKFIFCSIYFSSINVILWGKSVTKCLCALWIKVHAKKGKKKNIVFFVWFLWSEVIAGAPTWGKYKEYVVIEVLRQYPKVMTGVCLLIRTRKQPTMVPILKGTPLGILWCRHFHLAGQSTLAHSSKGFWQCKLSVKYPCYVLLEEFGNVDYQDGCDDITISPRKYL